MKRWKDEKRERKSEGSVGSVRRVGGVGRAEGKVERGRVEAWGKGGV